MPNDSSFADCNLVPIEGLPDLGTNVPDHVPDLVTERARHICGLPEKARGYLERCTGTMIDVGPGEGISSMALASLYPKASVVGIEMDRDHLKCAWPLCRDFTNLRLFWGAMPPTPSNPRVKTGAPAAPASRLDSERCKCDILFSWLGMSRRDIFEPADGWDRIVQDKCILVIPRIWRAGLFVLSDDDRSKLESLCDRLGLRLPQWTPALGVPGFRRNEVVAVDHGVIEPQKARGWILWLTGVFDSLGISLWDTLTDRWQPSPQYQLPELKLELEVVIGFK